jgi:hypothetical protein
MPMGMLTIESEILCQSMQKYLEKVRHRQEQSTPHASSQQKTGKEQVNQQDLQFCPSMIRAIADAELKNAPPKTDNTTRDASGKAQFFEIMTFKTVEEIDCETDVSEDDWNEIQAKIHDSIDTCALDLITPSTSAHSSQTSADALGLALKDNHSQHIDALIAVNRQDMQMFGGRNFGTEQTRGGKKPTACYRPAYSSDTFMERLRERLFNHEDVTDTVDVMGMAIF